MSDKVGIRIRHISTGDAATVVERGGKLYAKLDRGSVEVLRPYVEQHWPPDRDHRPVTGAQLAMIAWEADQKLCWALGLHGKREEWINLRDPERIKWMKEGPLSGPRNELYQAIMGALRKYAD